MGHGLGFPFCIERNVCCLIKFGHNRLNDSVQILNLMGWQFAQLLSKLLEKTHWIPRSGLQMVQRGSSRGL